MTTAADRLTRAWITMASQGQRESTDRQRLPVQPWSLLTAPLPCVGGRHRYLQPTLPCATTTAREGVETGWAGSGPARRTLLLNRGIFFPKETRGVGRG